MIAGQRVFIAIAGAGVLAANAAPAQPILATPSGAWQVNYAAESCRLARGFEHEGRKLAFIIDQFAPTASFKMIVAGEVLGEPTTKPVRVAFGPSGFERSFTEQMETTYGSYGPAIIVNAMELAAERSNERKGDEVSASMLAIASEPKPEIERAIRWFEVQRGTQRPIRFMLGPMDQPIAALRACMQDLMASWGIDVAAHQTLSKPATPRGNPGTWISPGDYPYKLLRTGAQGLIHFRLMTGEDGKVTGCHIQQSTRPAAFDEAVCQLFSRRARFDPALDASGRPIKSYWVSSVRFQLMD